MYPPSRRSATLDRNPKSRGGQSGHAPPPPPPFGGSTSNLTSMASMTSSAHLNLQQPHKSRSERDLTKVTKVRLRLSRDETAAAGEAKPSSSSKPKMKTTTMIGGADDVALSQTAAAATAGERVDVVRAPLNRHLGRERHEFENKFNPCCL